jgi:hypothetical protein
MQALGEALGIGSMTLYRWGKGISTPTLFVQRAVNAFARSKGVDTVPYPDAEPKPTRKSKTRGARRAG